MTKEIEIAGKTYSLRYDHNAMADLEEKAGMGIKALFNKQMDFAGARLMLWAGLKWRNQGLTLIVAGDLVQKFLTTADGEPLHTLDELMLIMVGAMKRSGVIRDEGMDDKGPDVPGADPLTPAQTEMPQTTV